MNIVHKKMAVRAGSLVLAVVSAAVLSACGGEKGSPKSGQALARVDGEEITVSQLNEELQRAGVQPAQQETASKQVLSSLVDRQLLLNAAGKEKLERDPKVVQAIERAKAQIIAQAYLQKRVGAPTPPSAAAVSAYFEKNPQFFAQRKQFDMRQLVLPTAELNDKAKETIDKATSLEQVAAWFDANGVKYARGQISRSSSDLPPELSARLLAMKPGQLFIVREGERSVLSQVVDVKDAPVTLAQATPQIQQFLTNQQTKQVAEAELAKLRGLAKIDYLNPAMTPGAKTPAPAAPAASAPAQATDSTARGVAGLK
ncbi:EpsD family peptidyl-prolyl cis-trans isomerase [Duganella sp. PWIR1]